MLRKAAFSLLAAAALTTGLVTPVAAQPAGKADRGTSEGGTVIVNNGGTVIVNKGDGNYNAGRDLLSGSGHTAGTGHTVGGVGSTGVLTQYQITNSTGAPLIYAQCQSPDPCTIAPGTGTRVEAGQTGPGFFGDNVDINFAIASVNAQGQIIATGSLALPREYISNLCGFATNVTCTSTASTPEPYNATVTVTAITGPPPTI